MKVSNKLPNAASALPNAETAKTSKTTGAESILDAKKPKAASSLGASDSAKVDLSQRAQDMRKAKELATPSDSIDEAKVARLQKMIDEGSYKIDAGAIADRLLDEQMKMPT